MVSVQVRAPRFTRVEATPFWQDSRTDAPLPPALTVWVELAKVVRPSVVNVSTTQRIRRSPRGDEFFRRFFELPEGRARQSLGSGFIVSPDGYVVTNNHVVGEADEIVVRLADQSEYRARVVGTDPKTDIALLKIDARGLPPLPFGDSDQIDVGAPVMAIGNPFGLEQTVTTGIVSAKERYIGSGPYDDFIQTDASVNPGNSGGPLVDAHGGLIGINTAIFSETGGSVGIGFAIPVNLAKQVLPQLKERGSVTRGYLGVAVGPVTPDAVRELRLPGRRGALVADVVPRSPAAAAGLRPGDVIVALEDRELQTPIDLTRRIAGTPPGTSVSLGVARADGRRTVKVTLSELRERPQPQDR
ncbi:MAG: trypsin-like peptidase domain-containing protein [Candidatus Rokubacteria bacterium]|nr:trypsin-like peptidase domain-containing protein [Candidatus Rokubacteria bacterium]